VNIDGRYLYRGVSEELHQRNGGRLVPKLPNTFEHAFKYGEGIKYGSGARYGSSDINAVLLHQLEQKGLPTSGISTTPIWDRAKFYALGGGKAKRGYIYIIDRGALSKYGVKQYTVSEYIPEPSIPEDFEVILVSSDFGPLPQEVIVEVKDI